MDSNPKNIEIITKKENLSKFQKELDERIAQTLTETKLYLDLYMKELEENQILLTENEILRKSFSDSKIKIQTLEQKKGQFPNEIQTKYQVILEENLSLETQVQSLQIEKKELLKKQEKLKKEVKEKKSSIEPLQIEIEDLKKDLESSKLEMECYKLEMAKKSVETEWYSRHNSEIIQDAKLMEFQNEDCKRIIEKVEKELQEAQQEIEKLEGKNLLLISENNEIMNSFEHLEAIYKAHISISIEFLQENMQKEEIIRNLNQEMKVLFLGHQFKGKTSSEANIDSSFKKKLKFDEFNDFSMRNFQKMNDNQTNKQMIQRVRSVTTNTIYSIKTRTHFLEYQAFKKEGKLWEKLKKLPEKPGAIPNFYGFCQEKLQLNRSALHLFFDYYPKSLKDLINYMKLKKISVPLSFPQLFVYAEKLISGFCFLQTLDICSLDIKAENFLLDQSMENIYIIDIRECQEIANGSIEEISLIGSKKYFSPELFEENKQGFNPFKSDVFSLGLILLELGTLEIPERGKSKKEWNKNIERSLNKFWMMYRMRMRDESEEKDLANMLNLIWKCLAINMERRPDFVEMYLDFQEKFVWDRRIFWERKMKK